MKTLLKWLTGYERQRIINLLITDADKWCSQNPDSDFVSFLQQRVAHQVALINEEQE